MNIMIITRLLTSGGAERVAANLASELSKKYNTILVVFDGHNPTYSCEAKIIDLHLPMQGNVFRKVRWYLKAIHEIKRIKKEYKITHSISFLNEPDLINILTPVGKCIVSVRSHRSRANKNRITFIKDKYVFGKADKIVALSQGVKQDLVQNYNIPSFKVDVIYNACDYNQIQNKMQEKPEDAFLEKLSGYDVINAGRLVDEKGQWHLIRSFTRVISKIPEAKLFILGQGPHEAYLRKLIELFDLEKNVFLMGYKTNPYAYLNKSTLYVFSSVREGFGNILLEAMACNLPIISSDCLYGPRELLEPGSSYDDICIDKGIDAKYGILIPICDGKKYLEETLTKEEIIMADQIIRVLKSKEEIEKYRSLSSKRIKDFSTDVITNQWEKTLNSL